MKYEYTSGYVSYYAFETTYLSSMQAQGWEFVSHAFIPGGDGSSGGFNVVFRRLSSGT
jgi:hypothetical protein